MARTKSVPHGEDPNKYASFHSQEYTTPLRNVERLGHNENTIHDGSVLQNPGGDARKSLNATNHGEPGATGGDKDDEAGNEFQVDFVVQNQQEGVHCALRHDTISEVDVAQNLGQRDMHQTEGSLTAISASVAPKVQESTVKGSVEKVDFKMNPIILTMLMVSNLVGAREDD
eukprot:15778341-Heterocapsa_arctica.AAC.1